MKMISAFVTMFAVTAFAGAAFAAVPETIVLPASKGKVTFPHKLHQETLQDCKKCHENGLGKIAELGKSWAHDVNCKKCHIDMNRAGMKTGPIKCDDCHMK
jgi:hypothetical protein